MRPDRLQKRMKSPRDAHEVDEPPPVVAHGVFHDLHDAGDQEFHDVAYAQLRLGHEILVLELAGTDGAAGHSARTMRTKKMTMAPET